MEPAFSMLAWLKNGKFQNRLVGSAILGLLDFAHKYNSTFFHLKHS
uniref:Uncharacterized protein n=1 Tax=Anguilla anguilla TaxID=7936 RepID=A0A0E9PFA8_ANGAN